MDLLQILFVLFCFGAAAAVWGCFDIPQPYKRAGFLALAVACGLWLFGLWGIGPGVHLRGRR